MRCRALLAALASAALFLQAHPAHAIAGVPVPRYPDGQRAAIAVTVPVVVPRVARERMAAWSADAADMKGYEPSMYRGTWYDPGAESARRCIMRRESHFSYRSANKSSSARGAYQFLDNNWRVSLTWMFIEESKRTHDGLIRQAKALRSMPINQWNRYWQDRAFYTAWRFGKGRHHWFHASIHCY